MSTTIPCSGVFDDGNTFFMMGRASRCLKAAGRKADAKEMSAKIVESGSYDAAVQVIMSYVEEGSDDEEIETDDMDYCDTCYYDPCQCQSAIDAGGS